MNLAKEGSCSNLICAYFYIPALVAKKPTTTGSRRNDVVYQCLLLTWGHGELNRPGTAHRLCRESRWSGRLLTATGKGRMLRDAGWLKCAFTPQLDARQSMTQQFQHKTHWIFSFCSAKTCKHSHKPRLTPQNPFLHQPPDLALLIPLSGCQDNIADEVLMFALGTIVSQSGSLPETSALLSYAGVRKGAVTG